MYNMTKGHLISVGSITATSYNFVPSCVCLAYLFAFSKIKIDEKWNDLVINWWTSLAMEHLGKKENQNILSNWKTRLNKSSDFCCHRTVYRCIDANNNNIECCIKRIKLIQTTNVLASKHFDMIQQEIYLLQNLIHPRIIHLYDYFYSNDNAFVHIVMELAAFGPLSKMIADRRSRMEFFQELVSMLHTTESKSIRFTHNVISF